MPYNMGATKDYPLFLREVIGAVVQAKKELNESPINKLTIIN